MTEPEIVVFASPADASHLAAIRIAAALTAAVATRGVAHFVTTGGTTPGNIYRHLADTPLRDAVPWHHVHLWWGDDRWVPPDDVLSNALACWDLLLRDVPVPISQVHVMPIADAMVVGEGPQVVAERYEATIRAAQLDTDADGFPMFDVILIGVGSDGHLFSVFPDSPTWDSAAWVQAVEAPSHIAPHVARVTLHPGMLPAARVPVVVVLGEAKTAIIAELFGPERNLRRLPAQLARRPGAVWILDEAAAAELPSTSRILRPAPIGDSGESGLPTDGR